MAADLINQIIPFMQEPVRKTFVPNHLKILCALHFYAHGSYQKSVGQDFLFNFSQSIVSRCINTISGVISSRLGRKFIKFPTAREEKIVLNRSFMEKFNFPGIVGCIDCTHVAIVAPPLDHPEYPGFAYLNRKGIHSINCQLICDSNLRILHCNAKYPGSTHDSAIWNMSNIRDHLEECYNNGEHGFWLLGDSGYPLQPWLLIPIEGAVEGTPEARYTSAHIRARNTIERCNGVLKMRFRCLHKQRMLHYSPIEAAKIIYSCCVLHNILVDRNVDK